MSISNIILLISLAFLLSIWVTGAVRSAALALNFVDYPGEGRKVHSGAVPLLGGIAIFLSFFGVVGFLYLRGYLPPGYLHFKELAALFSGGLILILGGALDDKYNLPPSKQIIFPVLAAAVAVSGGIHFTFIRNPFGGILPLDLWNLHWTIGGQFISFLFPADIFSFLWLLGMIYTTKLLDGLDGLSAGISGIAAVLIAALALRPELWQPQMAILAIAFAAVLVGFLVWNFHPARIFLGEGGSTFVGFMAGALAIAAGSKVATTLLVLGVPLLDVAAVILRRLSSGAPVAVGDRGHLHFRLLDAGFTHRRAVIIYYLFAIIFGGTSWFMDTAAKVVSFAALFVLFLILLFYTGRKIK